MWVATVVLVFERLIICSRHEAGCLRHSGATHLLSIANPGAQIQRPTWFSGKHLCLFFGDVVSEADARQCGTTPANVEHVAKALEFSRQAWRSTAGKLVIHCEYGASRSPAMAYVLMADRLGPGQESEALNFVLELRPNALPNKLVVEVGDTLLNRSGQLVKPLRAFYAEVNRELQACFGPQHAD
jgi:predicted protein tyrosine phosphatase